MISRKTSPISMIAAICGPMPRRGASSVVLSRSGRPEPRAVTGSLLQSVKVDRSIAEGPVAAPIPAPRNGRAAAILVGVLLAAAAFLVYWWSNPVHWNQYNHFVWQADAFLHGRAWFPYPVPSGAELPQNDYLQDVYPLRDAAGDPDGRALLPFPPLPALVLMPFVALYGLATDQETVAIALAALGVALAWWMLGSLRLRSSVRAAGTLVFATGTVWWWAAAVGSTWYLAHLVAVDLAFVAVGIALRHDRAAVAESPWEEGRRKPGRREAGGRKPGGREAGRREAAGRGGSGLGSSRLARIRGSVWPLDRSQVVAGFVLGLAVTARLPMIFAAPFFVFTGGGGSWPRRAASAAVGGFLPVAALLLYTVITTGSFMHPGYDYQYQLEANGYPTLGYHPDWSVEDARYIPQNLGIMFGSLPVVAPDIKPDTLGYGDPVALCSTSGASRSLFDLDCPLVMPVDVGTSILLSAPGLLLALFAFRRHGLARLSIGTAIAVIVVAAFNLAHFSQGWVQWGYRFSLDFVPFLLPMVALGAARDDGRLRVLAAALIVLGAAINLWGVTWGQVLGW